MRAYLILRSVVNTVSTKVNRANFPFSGSLGGNSQTNNQNNVINAVIEL